jgi:predicted nucleic acid-binding Zn ribbon protein
MRELTAADAARKKIVNRLTPMTCAACGRKVKRQSRQQRYCSDRCRDFARRERNASQINARTAIKNPAGYQDSGQPTNPHFLSNRVNGLQERKTGSSIPLNILGGYRWPNAGGVERELLRKIVRAEIGGAP